jgi:hypothetical protein
LAHHFTQAGLTDTAIEWWGKAGQQSLEHSALVAKALTRISCEIRGWALHHRSDKTLCRHLTRAQRSAQRASHFAGNILVFREN